MTLPNKYDSKSVEDKWIKIWDDLKLYKSEVNPEKPKYSVVIPPPNVTGILHIGHILNNTIQDIYCRWKRMLGYEVCWVPGMDHAGIATQIKVEEQLAKQNIKKEDLGREEFVKIIWDWKEKYGGIIFQQLRKLGVSVDWSKERFTLDEGLSKAVRTVFVDLYKKGYIYKGLRIINWDNKSQTALSDDEISYKEQKDKLYYVKYPLSESNDSIIIATTRPETMLGDTAVAVNPHDSRYKKYINKFVILPIVNKKIPIIEDDYVDKEFGTGALKITPAHDMNDFELSERHNLELINIFTKDGKINENGGIYSGESIESAREKIIMKLKDLNLLTKVEDYTHNIAISERSGAIIEPFISEQWFVSMKKISDPAIEAVKNGKVNFYPEKWTKTYYHWLNNIKDWCISRQLWWGHQIPIWYKKSNNEVYCEVDPPNDSENWIQDQDVLDTWFSSWIWPFSVFGWENTEKDNTNKNLQYYYPTDFLSTAPEIIFLWVARMIISGIEYMKDVPFKNVYFHSTVRDGIGRKMSKSLGNSPDPLEVIDKYGADALRFTIIYLAPLGSDILFDEKYVEIGRNFITKLWNAGRFILMNIDKNKIDMKNLSQEISTNNFIDLWIISKYNYTLNLISNNLNGYRLNDYAKANYNFVWDNFCDWYLELIKIRLKLGKENPKVILGNALQFYFKILKFLHPIIPFVTEELWNEISENEKFSSISFSEFPKLIEINKENSYYFEKLINFTTIIRNYRADAKINYKQKLDVNISVSVKNDLLILNLIKEYIEELCNCEISINKYCDKNSVFTKIYEEFEINILYPSMIEDENKQKYDKEIENLQSFLKSLKNKLENEQFLKNAPKSIIEKEKAKYEDTLSKIEKLKKLL
jgi:valyl-tRNA synthetase